MHTYTHVWTHTHTLVHTHAHTHTHTWHTQREKTHNNYSNKNWKSAYCNRLCVLLVTTAAGLPGIPVWLGLHCLSILLSFLFIFIIVIILQHWQVIDDSWTTNSLSALFTQHSCFRFDRRRYQRISLHVCVHDFWLPCKDHGGKFNESFPAYDFLFFKWRLAGTTLVRQGSVQWLLSKLSRLWISVPRLVALQLVSLMGLHTMPGQRSVHSDFVCATCTFGRMSFMCYNGKMGVEQILK